MNLDDLKIDIKEIKDNIIEIKQFISGTTVRLKILEFVVYGAVAIILVGTFTKMCGATPW